MNIIVHTPHSCLLSLFSSLLGELCDYRSRTYGRIIHKFIENSIYIQSRTLRAICDNNRIQCRNTPSRKRLREYMKNGNFIVFEIHTFPPDTINWKLDKNPSIVLLTVGNDNRLLYRVYEILKPYFSIDIVQGSDVNDIQMEVQEYGGSGVLIELNQTLSLDQAKQIGQLLNRM